MDSPRLPSSADLALLESRFPGQVLRNVPLARLSRWRIGGRCDALVRPRDLATLCQLRGFLAARGLAHVVIGATSNLLFSDAGLRAIAVQIGPGFDHCHVQGDRVTVGAGLWVPALARRAMQAGLSGLEHACGIPGTVGGLICMNGGSQRHGIGEAVIGVESVDATGGLRWRPAKDCGFGYRQSVFQTNGEIITGAQLCLTRPEGRGQGEIRREMLEILAARRRKFPHQSANCGSVFVSNPAMHARHGPPGAVIEALGFKGHVAGGARVSPQHANFIENTGGARARDVLHLIRLIQTAVAARTGHVMAVEVRHVAPDGTIRPADHAPFPEDAHD